MLRAALLTGVARTDTASRAASLVLKLLMINFGRTFWPVLRTAETNRAA